MSPRRVLKYDVGDSHPSGGKVDFICGHSDDVIVFLDSAGLLQWETALTILTDVQRLVHQEFDRLYGLVTAWIPKPRRRPHIHALGSALFLALSEPDGTKAVGHFADLSGRILHEAQRQGRLAYFLAGTVGAVGVSAIAVGLIALIPDVTFREIASGAVAGSFGAWTSILQRSSKLRLDPFETSPHLRFQGATRIALGIVFGLVAVAAIRSGILFPAAASDVWLQSIVVFLAGFSERLVPELLGRLEAKAGNPEAPEREEAS